MSSRSRACQRASGLAAGRSIPATRTACSGERCGITSSARKPSRSASRSSSASAPVAARRSAKGTVSGARERSSASAEPSRPGRPLVARLAGPRRVVQRRSARPRPRGRWPCGCRGRARTGGRRRSAGCRSAARGRGGRPARTPPRRARRSSGTRSGSRFGEVRVAHVGESVGGRVGGEVARTRRAPSARRGRRARAGRSDPRRTAASWLSSSAPHQSSVPARFSHTNRYSSCARSARSSAAAAHRGRTRAPRRAAPGAGSRRGWRCRRRRRARPPRGGCGSRPAGRRAPARGSTRRRRGRSMKSKSPSCPSRRSEMSPWRSSTFSMPTASIVPRPSAIGAAARSMPSAEIPGVADRHRDQVAAGAAADLEHARRRRVGRREPVQRRRRSPAGRGASARRGSSSSGPRRRSCERTCRRRTYTLLCPQVRTIFRRDTIESV